MNRRNIKQFPGAGYSVVVLRKEDVLKTIDDNIIDKSVALDLIKQCEIDAANFVKEGRTAILPYIGSIYFNAPKKAVIDSVNELHEANKNLSRKEYLLFKKRVAANKIKQLKYIKQYKSSVRFAIRINKKLYKNLVKYYSESYANLQMYFSRNLKYIEPEL